MTNAFRISRHDYDAVIFDLDGVLLHTAVVHAAAWKALFDTYLAERQGETYEPFDIEADYLQYVDGKPRYAGVQSFLASRHIQLPYGTPQDGPQQQTVCGLGNRKDALFLERVERDGVTPDGTALAWANALHDAGFKLAVASSSRNCKPLLQGAGILNLFETVVDGVDIDTMGMKGKPDPDMFLEAARRLVVTPDRCVVVEDAIAGVEAGHRGAFGTVVGMDRAHQAEALSAHGADVVVTDLSAIPIVDGPAPGHRPGALPSALDQVQTLARRAAEKPLGVFLDYDGTLTPIVSRPELAILSPAMREVLRELATRCTVAIVSGRDLADVRRLVDVPELFYSGSHGFDIATPDGGRREHPRGADYLPALDATQALLEERLAPVSGAIVERKRFSLAAHYRLVGESEVQRVREAVDDALAEHPALRLAHGKMVFELRPKIEWHKGKAVRWLVEVIQDAGRSTLTPLYIGDDVTDEDALGEIRADGIGIFVGDGDWETAAHYRLADPDEVQRLLARLAEVLPEGGDNV